jgi:hypothetical protein
VDNSAYPQVTIEIQLSLTTPTNAAAPVPVIMEFGLLSRPGGPPRPPSRAGVARAGTCEGLALFHSAADKRSSR